MFLNLRCTPLMKELDFSIFRFHKLDFIISIFINSVDFVIQGNEEKTREILAIIREPKKSQNFKQFRSLLEEDDE